MRRRPTAIELSLERRDSTLTCRSRALVCASCERARAEPSAARRSSRSSLSVRSRAASSAASACARASSAAARDRASSAAALSRAMSAALCCSRSPRSLTSSARAWVALSRPRSSACLCCAACSAVWVRSRSVSACACRSRAAASSASASATRWSASADAPRRLLRRCSRSRVPARGSGPRLTRSQSRPTHSPAAVMKERPSTRAPRAASALPSDSAVDTAASLHPRLRLGERARAPLARATRLGFLERELAELRAALLRAETEPLSGEPFGLRPKLPQLVLELLDAGTLDLGGLLRPARRPRVLFPALLPLLERLLARLERRAGALLGLLRGLALGREPRDLRTHRGELALIAGDVRRELPECRLRLREIRALALAQLAGVLDRLLEPRDVGSDLVVAALHRRQTLAVRGLHRTLLLDHGLGGALRGERLLHGELAPAHRGVVHLAAAVEVPQAHRQELRGEASLLLLERLVAPGGRRLTLQVPDLLLHLVAHVLEPLEILAGLGDARLGLLAPLLVARDTGGFLDEGAHVLALRLDDARDRALLDDGVAARAEPRAEKQVGDVLAPAAHAVDEVRRGVVARHLALQRDLAVARVGAADLAVGVVEHQLHGGHADRLARGGAIEHHVRHVVAAQMLGGELAHHPAHGVDDVRLAAAVGTDDTGEIAGEGYLGGIDEGLEAGELDLGQPHRACLPPPGRPRGWCSVEEYAHDAHQGSRDLREPRARSRLHHSHADSRVHVSVSAHRAAGLRDAGSGVRARPAVRGAQIAEALYLVVPRPWRVSRGSHERNCRSPRRDAPRAVPPPHCALQRARRDLHDRCRRQTTGRLGAAAEGGPAVEVPRPRRRSAAHPRSAAPAEGAHQVNHHPERAQVSPPVQPGDRRYNRAFLTRLMPI